MELPKSICKLDGRCLLMLAAALHLAAAGTVELVGRRAALPNLFDRHGIIQGSDSQGNWTEAVALAGDLSRREFAAWSSYDAQPHVKLYSVTFALFGRWLGDGILAMEPLNLAYYLTILVLVYRLGEELADRRVGLAAAGVVAVWPSFLLHTTQLLRDPLYVAALLMLVLILSGWLPRAGSWRQGAATGALGALACAVLWAVRGQMWELTVAAVLLGLGLLALWRLCERRTTLGNVIGAVILLAALAGVPRCIPTTRHTDTDLAEELAPGRIAAGPGTDRALPSAGQATPQADDASPSLGLARRITGLRKRMTLRYATAGSNLDTDVDFADLGDVFRYLPRALVIGWFAPFPRMWFNEGRELGAAGRKLSGLETLGIYLISPLALFSLRRWRRLAVWQFWSIAVMGMTGLGLVVVNIGGLYRARYSFWILLILLAADGALQARELLPKRQPR
jgi:hypothetical protein